jgi:large subunit ribosomal protein L11
MAFCKEYNAKTSNRIGEVVPAEITIFTDGSFKFILKSPPTAFLIRRAAALDKGSSEPNKNKVGKLTRQQIREIAEIKMKDLNAVDVERHAQIEGTARSMGVVVEE